MDDRTCRGSAFLSFFRIQQPCLHQDLPFNTGKTEAVEQSGQTTEFAPFDESGNISPDSTRAKSDSFGPIAEVLRSLIK